MSRSIVKEVLVNAPLDVVWRALTDAGELARWFPVEARVEPGLGGSIWISWGAGAEGTAPITGWDPGRHFQWTETRGPIKLAIDFHLEGQGGSTVVRLVQSGFGDGGEWDDEFHATTGGWSYFLENLRWYLERHRGVPRDLISFREAVPFSRPEAYARMVAALGAVETRAFLERPQSFHLGAIVPSLNDAMLLVEVEPAPEGARVGFWLSTYGLSPAALAEARAQFGAVYEQMM